MQWALWPSYHVFGVKGVSWNASTFLRMLPRRASLTVVKSFNKLSVRFLSLSSIYVPQSITMLPSLQTSRSSPFFVDHPVQGDIAYLLLTTALLVPAFWPILNQYISKVKLHFKREETMTAYSKTNCSFCFCLLLGQIILDTVIWLDFSFQFFDVWIYRLQLRRSFLARSFSVGTFSSISNVINTTGMST